MTRRQCIRHAAGVLWVARQSFGNPNEEFVVIDAGANVGRWLIAFHRIVTSPGRLYAFEPQPSAAQKVRELNLDQCEVLELALGDQPGNFSFYTSNETDSTGSLYERRDSFGSKEYSRIEVEVVRLDDFVKQRKIKQIDFMKMDLEGNELNALKGASECLRTGMLRALSFEFGSSNINSRIFFKDMFSLFRDNQYSIARITPAGRLIPVKKYAEDYEVFARTSTYLARRGDS